MPFSALVVDANDASRASMVQALASAGHHVMCVSLFEDAKRRLSLAPPDVLIAAVRLGAYSGLHLVLRARAENPRVAAIVIDTHADSTLEAEAKKLQAGYIVGTPDREKLLALVNELLAGVPAKASSIVERQWLRKSVDIPVGVAEAVQAKLVDVSYGGLRLELSGLPDERLSRLDAVAVPNVGRLPVRAIWARGTAGKPGFWWCGAEVAPTAQHTTRAWRKLVDSLD